MGFFAWIPLIAAVLSAAAKKGDSAQEEAAKKAALQGFSPEPSVPEMPSMSAPNMNMAPINAALTQNPQSTDLLAKLLQSGQFNMNPLGSYLPDPYRRNNRGNV